MYVASLFLTIFEILSMRVDSRNDPLTIAVVISA